MIDRHIVEQRVMRIHITIYTPEEWQALNALHERYQSDHDFFSPKEHQYLSFLRWLVQMGRLVP